MEKNVRNRTAVLNCTLETNYGRMGKRVLGFGNDSSGRGREVSGGRLLARLRDVVDEKEP